MVRTINVVYTNQMLMMMDKGGDNSMFETMMMQMK